MALVLVDWVELGCCISADWMIMLMLMVTVIVIVRSIMAFLDLGCGTRDAERGMWDVGFLYLTLFTFRGGGKQGGGRGTSNGGKVEK